MELKLTEVIKWFMLWKASIAPDSKDVGGTSNKWVTVKWYAKQTCQHPEQVKVHIPQRCVCHVHNLLIYFWYTTPLVWEWDHWCRVHQVPVLAALSPMWYRQAGTWANGHRNTNQCAVESGDCPNSAMADYISSCHHPVDWDNTRVLHRTTPGYCMGQHQDTGTTPGYCMGQHQDTGTTPG